MIQAMTYRVGGIIGIALAVVMLLPLQLQAHHSASRFNFEKNVEVEGVVKHVRVANPHIELVLTVENGDGSTRDIEFEGHSRNNVFRKGWRPDMIKEGDEITIRIAPMRNGEDGGYVQSFILADGTEI